MSKLKNEHWLWIFIAIISLGWYGLSKDWVTTGMLAFGLFIYMLPSFIGSKKNQFTALFFLNVLAGWTFVGYVGAFVWALMKDKEPEKVIIKEVIVEKEVEKA